MITKYHAKYYATVLSNQAIGGQIDSLSQSLLNAAVDINPHQIEAALFAFKSPLSKGVIFADEVGLGKTIEAGLVLCQYWAVGKRKIIVICPASIRKQWGYELTEKFGIENEVLDARNYRDYERRGLDPLDQKKVVICSYNFAARKKDEIKRHGFDFAIIDEAHKLRNVYKKKAKTAQAIKEALSDVKKLLLTATPFQNSLMELFGLTSVVDDNIFGDARSFRAEYVYDENLSDLRQRLLPYYQRTLRRDVKEYINYTNRLPITQQFDATDLESKLYEDVSEFLRREDIYSVPKRQRMLTTMIIRKILASSTYALIGTLRTVKARLEQMLNNEAARQLTLADYMDEDEAELYEEDDDDENLLEDEKIDLDKLREEIHTIEGFIETALKIQHDSKSEALLQALDQSFQMLPKTGAKQKALIFTESTRTQQYLKDYLNQHGYLVLSHLAVSAFDDEQYCLFTAFTKDGRFLTQEDCEKLFLCGGVEAALREISPEVRRKLGVNSVQHTKSKLQQIDSRNLEYFRDEEERIFRWEKDLIESIERELDIVKRAIREQERLSRSAANMEEKLAITKKIDELERQKRKKRNELADREDEVSAQRRRMIEELDRRKVQKTATDDIFVIAWNAVS